MPLTNPIKKCDYEYGSFLFILSDRWEIDISLSAKFFETLRRVIDR